MLASETLSAQVSGAASVAYFGNPELLRRTVTDAGNVEKGRK
ncbi:MAG: hypothetical protein ACE5FU_09930 [Nitrospinota bacterium]